MEKIRTLKMLTKSNTLNSAVEAKNEVMVKLLLWSGASVNARDSEGRTVLHKACQIVLYNVCGLYENDEYKYEQRRKIIDMLLRSGAEVNVQDNDGRTPLHEACFSNDPSVVTLLRRYGAKIGLVDRKGNTPLHDALRWHENCDNPSPLVNALLDYNGAGRSNDQAQHLIDSPADEDTQYALNVKGKFGWTPLHLASRRNNRDVVCILLRKGANVGVKDDDGRTPLHLASLHYALDVADVLVDNGEDVNAKDLSGDTPISLICENMFEFKDNQMNIIHLDYMMNVGYMVHRKFDNLKPTYKMTTAKGHINYGTRKKIEETFMKHVIKLEMFNPQVRLDIKWKLRLDLFNLVKSLCCQEFEDMKSINIVQGISLYEVLSRTNRPYPLSSDDILIIDEFLCSPDLMTRFPLYGLSLRTTFQRPKLLTLAVQSFYTERRNQMVKELPCEVTEQLLTYLTNEDLRNFIRSEACERVTRCLNSFNMYRIVH